MKSWQSSKKEFEKLDFAVKDYTYGDPDDYRSEGRLVYTHKRPKGVVEKCTLCVQHIDKGEKPVCVRSCPGNARFFGDLDNPASKIRKLINNYIWIVLKPEAGTRPNVYYIRSFKAAPVV